MSASRINSLDANFPVPTSRRDANSRSAIFSFEGLSAMEKDKRIRGHARMRISAQAVPVVVGSMPPTQNAQTPVTGLRASAAAETDRLSRLYKTSSHNSWMTKFDLRREDCITGMSRLADASVDLVVTSPPYNLGIIYGKYSDRQDRRSYLGWCGEWAGQVRES